MLWLWRRPVATAPIRPLAWEPPYAVGVVQEMAKRPKKEKEIEEKILVFSHTHTHTHTHTFLIIAILVPIKWYVIL